MIGTDVEKEGTRFDTNIKDTTQTVIGEQPDCSRQTAWLPEANSQYKLLRSCFVGRQIPFSTSHLTETYTSSWLTDIYILCGVNTDTSLTPHSISLIFGEYRLLHFWWLIIYGFLISVVSCGVCEVSALTPHAYNDLIHNSLHGNREMWGQKARRSTSTIQVEAPLKIKGIFPNYLAPYAYPPQTSCGRARNPCDHRQEADTKQDSSPPHTGWWHTRCHLAA